MSPSEASTVVVAVAALITAIGTTTAALLSSLKTQRQMNDVSLRTSTVQTTVDGIHNIVNGSAAEMRAKMGAMQSELDLLRRLLQESNTRAELLAQAKATEKIAGKSD